VLNGSKEFPEEEVVIISQVLASEVNIGYQNLTNIQVIQVNNIKVKNLKDLVHLVESNQEKYICFHLEHSRSIILDATEVVAFNDIILKQHSIAFSKSEDLK